jgi:hypothetical protein
MVGEDVSTKNIILCQKAIIHKMSPAYSQPVRIFYAKNIGRKAMLIIKTTLLIAIKLPLANNS